MARSKQPSVDELAAAFVAARDAVAASKNPSPEALADMNEKMLAVAEAARAARNGRELTIIAGDGE